MDKERPSPSDHAKDFPDKLKVGNDENVYVSKKDKNGIYKWYKIEKKKNPEEYYQQFPNYITPNNDTKFFYNNLKNLRYDLKKIGVKFYFIKWGMYDPQFEYEYFQEDNLKLDDSENDDYILYSENRLYWDARKEGIMFLQHDVSKDKWDNVNNILKKYFPNRTHGITTKKDAIKIFFDEKKNIKKDKEKVMFLIDIIFDDKKIDKDLFKYWNKIDKIIKKKNIGYLEGYDAIGSKNLSFNINNDKIDNFKEIIDKIENNKFDLPKVKEISYDIID
jgi:hypothetical protein